MENNLIKKQEEAEKTYKKIKKENTKWSKSNIDNARRKINKEIFH